MAQPRLRDAGAGLDVLKTRVRRLADAVGLRDYAFEVELKKLDPGVRAICACPDSRRYARITVCEDFFELEESEQQEALLHEVLHVQLHPLRERVEDLRSELGRAHFESFEAGFRRDLERVVDGLAQSLAGVVAQ